MYYEISNTITPGDLVFPFKDQHRQQEFPVALLISICPVEYNHVKLTFLIESNNCSTILSLSKESSSTLIYVRWNMRKN